MISFTVIATNNDPAIPLQYVSVVAVSVEINISPLGGFLGGLGFFFSFTIAAERKLEIDIQTLLTVKISF